MVRSRMPCIRGGSKDTWTKDRRTCIKAMSEGATTAPLTGFDLWTPNDYSNFITICAAAVGSTLLVIFKSRCVKISLFWGLWSCDREVQNDGSDDEEDIVPAGNVPRAAPPLANDQP
jgi:hypothetical protein